VGEGTDEELMHQFFQGDPGAFNALFDRHAPAVHSFLTRMVRNRQLADDLLQTTFLSVVRSRGRFEAPDRVLPWFLSIAANAARDAMRRHSNRNEELTATGQMPESSEGETLSDPVLRRRLEAALDTLPPEQKEVVLLHLVQGWSFEDIAQSHQLNAATVRVRAHRGLKKLRALLGHLGEA